MENKYDVIIVGAGPAGIMASYEFYLKKIHKLLHKINPL